MRELTEVEMEQVDGGMSDFTTGGMAVIAIGFAGGPATAAFGLLVGGSMLIVGHYQQN
ncbi:Blp family class II bacteriocin [Xanthomonas oryzae]|uniref:Blp family class II bacteriocin n=1 Tax=Xanthomonas oryzae TaxID=347 RepID=UPI002DE4441B|nr:Blp family class II bacteriocin [Xanthomonas oryzae]MEC5079421.1 Blp family class II bacteriocin [Xanthomonas oryzae pv. oryzicola]MEC5114044.1 Blp family class II bacteriocin [Xanthomonas oryzae pv. oryzicola]